MNCIPSVLPNICSTALFHDYPFRLAGCARPEGPWGEKVVRDDGKGVVVVGHVDAEPAEEELDKGF